VFCWFPGMVSGCTYFMLKRHQPFNGLGPLSRA
jgi:hypothetical protein